MADIVEWMRALRWPVLVVLALLAVVMLAPGGLLVAWATASWWVLAAALAVLTAARTAGWPRRPGTNHTAGSPPPADPMAPPLGILCGVTRLPPRIPAFRCGGFAGGNRKGLSLKGLSR